MLLAHEWVSATGGSEKVFDRLMQVFPDADAMCLWKDSPLGQDRRIAETSLAHSRLRGSKMLSLPRMPSTWRRVDLEGYDVVLASSHAFAHHLPAHAVRQGLKGFAYVHTPARYVWAPEVEARGRHAFARTGRAYFKHVDRAATHDGVSYAANSRYIRDRIRRSWDKDARVIYPPVDVETIQDPGVWEPLLRAEELQFLGSLPDAFVLGASRLVEYKRLDLVMQVGEQLGLPVVIAGDGPDAAALRERALKVSVPVHFAGRVSDPVLFDLYRRAALFVFLPVEDFGIMPVEAMASGTPVLVSSAGGARESVERTGGGRVVPDLRSTSDLMQAATEALTIDMTAATVEAGQFSGAAFDGAIREWITSTR